MPGKLIVIEGLDGSGKSTQTELLQKKLAALSVDTKRIKLPDYDDPSSTLVRMYLGGEFGNVILPSRFGQVIPPFNAMRYTFSPNWDFNA